MAMTVRRQTLPRNAMVALGLGLRVVVVSLFGPEVVVGGTQSDFMMGSKVTSETAWLYLEVNIRPTWTHLSLPMTFFSS